MSNSTVLWILLVAALIGPLWGALGLLFLTGAATATAIVMMFASGGIFTWCFRTWRRRQDSPGIGCRRWGPCWVLLWD